MDAFFLVAVIGYILAAVCLIISVFLYFKLQIPQVIRRLRTIPSKQKIAVKEKEQKQNRQRDAFHYAQNAEKLGLFDFESITGEQPQNAYESDVRKKSFSDTSGEGNNRTTVLQQGQAGSGTVVLNAAQTAKGTVVLQQAENGNHFRIIKNIVMIHTDETI